MLTELTIDNFAIIGHLQVRVEEGFTVVTGETGAGKSILVDALQAVLGGRTSSDAIRAGASNGAIEAIFELPDGFPERELLSQQGIEHDGTLILRRDFGASGRSTARINGRAIPLATLASLGAGLVDIHGQSNHLSMLKRDAQLDALDRYGDLLESRERTANALRAFSRGRDELRRLREGRREAEQRLDLLRFQHAEIQGAALSAAEDEELLAERSLLLSVEKRSLLATQAIDELGREVGGAVEAVYRAATAAAELAAIDPDQSQLAERVEGAHLELEDMLQDLRRYQDTIQIDPGRLEAVEERLDHIARLKRKYGATLSEVIDFGEEVARELEVLGNPEERLDVLAGEVERQAQEAGQLLAQLSAARRDAARQMEMAMGHALQGLGLRHTAFEIDIQQMDAEHGIELPDGRRVAFTNSGADHVTFLVSFNPGEPPRPLDKVASGGETSRFMLALRSVLARVDRVPTLIFDEVDVGVGGRDGGVVGERLRGLSADHQVISISHLAQVAVQAGHHLHVSKEIIEERTDVQARYLDERERISEMAKMMSGTETEAARRIARELYETAGVP
ncbi:MAG: DNA repair protein RecN [Chloroflexota bacterium]